MKTTDYWKWCSEEADRLLAQPHALTLEYIRNHVAQYLPDLGGVCPRPKIHISLRQRALLLESERPICYSFYPQSWCELLIASQGDKICFLGFVHEDRAEALDSLQSSFPKVRLLEQEEPIQLDLINWFVGKEDLAQPIEVVLYGTDFQLKVWTELHHILPGSFLTYKAIGENIGVTQGFQAIGSAIGRNPVAYFIPCHCVLNVSGELSGFRWGLRSKLTLLISELLNE